MSDPIEKAKDFIEHQQAFRLGDLTTESFHPKTKFLSQTAATNLRTAISMLSSPTDCFARTFSTGYA